MTIIRTHNITLQEGSPVLRPLCDDHLPLLYRWNADPEVLYWTEGGDDPSLSYSPDTVHQIYGGISQQGNLCFAIEIDGTIIGECWLQRMNLPEVLAQYPEGTDIRRIDMCIGEKSFWCKGIGSRAMGLLVEFAFTQENVDILHCINEDYNHRSRRMMEKNGFTLIHSVPLPQPQIGKFQLHWRLTREEYEIMHGDSVGNYARHAAWWDWGGHDRTEEHEYWHQYACKYGSRVLIPMCVLGETGAYMAQRGMQVTAFDMVPEMIAEGQKRFGHLSRLKLCLEDVRDFHLDTEPYDFAFSMDFGHLLTLEDTRSALGCLHTHLRPGGALVLEVNLRLPNAENHTAPQQTFEPLRQVYPGWHVWKTGSGHTDAATGRHYIRQHFYMQDDSGHTDSFEHSFYLQSYTREDWLAAFDDFGFTVVGEYADRQLHTWNSGNSLRIFELRK